MISFSPNCTLPTTAGTFVSAPDVRGTMDIVWSCGSVLILCCWSILHPNIPPQFRPKSKLRTFRRGLFLSFEKVKLFFTILTAPEFVMTKAVLDLRSAKAFEEPLKDFARIDGVPWSLTHSFFANMGGFLICFPPEDEWNRNDPETSFQCSSGRLEPIALPVNDHHDQSGDKESANKGLGDGDTGENGTNDDKVSNQRVCPSRTTNKTSTSLLKRNDLSGSRRQYQQKIERFARLFGETTWRPNSRHTSMSKQISLQFNKIIREAALYSSSSLQRHNLLAIESNVWILNAPQLLLARRYGIIKRLPYITEQDLKDKSKGDFLIKALAIIQILWLVVQLILRFAYGKAASQLEIMTVAYSVCAFITYCWKGDGCGHVTQLA